LHCCAILLDQMDAKPIGIGTTGDTIGAGIGIRSHAAQFRKLLLAQLDVHSGELLSPSVSLGVVAGFSVLALDCMYARKLLSIGPPTVRGVPFQ